MQYKIREWDPGSLHGKDVEVYAMGLSICPGPVKALGTAPWGLPAVLCFPSLDTWPLSPSISLSWPVPGQAALGTGELIGQQALETHQ